MLAGIAKEVLIEGVPRYRPQYTIFDRHGALRADLKLTTSFGSIVFMAFLGFIGFKV